MSGLYRESRASWRGISLTIRHCPAWGSTHNGPVQHVEVESDGHVPIPITETGYRSHFMIGDQAMAAYSNDPVAFVLAWLDHEATTAAWKSNEAAARQMVLF